MSRKDHPNNAPGVPMLFPVWFEKWQTKYFNPAVKPIARYLPTFSVIKHRGRTSGKPYETIVTAYRKGNVVAIGLAHGKTDWVKNVLAAGEADLHFIRKDVHITNPRQGAALLGAPADRTGRGPRRRYRLEAAENRLADHRRPDRRRVLPRDHAIDDRR
jgi:deazaflavin-dependent oxidoreductase (nitroreductase family)